MRYTIILFLAIMSVLSCEKDRETLVVTKPDPVVIYKQIGIVGDATSVGWNIGSPIKMTADKSGFIHTWTGEFKPGKFKVPLILGAGWGVPSLRPIKDGETDLSLTTSQILDESKGQADFKWQITDATKGNYTFTVDLTDLDNIKVKFIKN
jgi:hypothetical protein